MFSLLDVLLGRIKNNEDLFSETVLHNSIQNNLILLLNSRQGSLHHLPNYGLPDLNCIYQDLPHSLHSFSRRLIEVIENYEPRLVQVMVQYKPSQQTDCVIYFEINAKIRQGSRIYFDTYFMSCGKAIVESAENYH